MACFGVKGGGKEERDEERTEDSDGGAGWECGRLLFNQSSCANHQEVTSKRLAHTHSHTHRETHTNTQGASCRLRRKAADLSADEKALLKYA